MDKLVVNFNDQSKDDELRSDESALLWADDDWEDDLSHSQAAERQRKEAEERLEALSLSDDVYRGVVDVESPMTSEFGSFPSHFGGGVAFKPSSAGFGLGPPSSLRPNKLQPEGKFYPDAAHREAQQARTTLRSEARTETPAKLDPLPPYYERYSSYEVPVTKGTSSLDVAKRHKDKLVDCLNKMTKLRVNFQEVSSNFVLEGVSYVRHDSCKWKIQIFEHVADGSMLIVEVQRRSGSSFAFRQFYQDLRSSSEGQARPRFASQVTGDSSELLADPADTSIEAHVMDDAVLKSLGEWAKSPYLDQRTEGMRVLLQMMEGPKNLAHTSEAVGKSELVSIFVDGLNSGDVEVRRLAAAGLFRCSQNEQLVPIISRNLSIILKSLRRSPGIEEIDGHHYVLRSVSALLGGKNGPQLRQQYEKEFGRLFEIETPQLADDISSLRSLPVA